MPTYKDYDSREEFVKSLGLYHHDKFLKTKEFTVMSGLVNGFDQELADIKQNIEVIRDTWNDQSISQIEQSVFKSGERHLKIMQGQKNDKLAAGYTPNQPMYRMRQCPDNSVFYDLARNIGLDYPCARFHVQFPGEVTIVHTDIFSPAHEFLPEAAKNIPDEKIGHDSGIRRILIALEDWNWGQIVMFGAQSWSQWKAGDISYWKYGVPHCAANMGYTPRISASITGMANDKFYKIFNYDQ